MDAISELQITIDCLERSLQEDRGKLPEVIRAQLTFLRAIRDELQKAHAEAIEALTEGEK